MAEIKFLNVAGWPRPCLNSDPDAGKIGLRDAAEFWRCPPEALKALWLHVFRHGLAQPEPRERREQPPSRFDLN